MCSMFLDDERFPEDVTWVKIPDVEYIVVRSFDEAVRFIEEKGCPDHISFDHDLGELNGVALKSGYDLAKYLVELDLDANVIPNRFSFTVHSKNPVGCTNITELLNSYLRYRNEETHSTATT